MKLTRALAMALVVGGSCAAARDWKRGDPVPAALLHCETPKLSEGRARAAPTPALAKPAKGVPYSDPRFHTCVVRATDHAQDGPVGFAREDYARRQAFNADDSLFLVVSHDGSWYLYDANSLRMIERLPFLAGDAEPQWDPRDPYTLYYGERNGGLVISGLDVRSNSRRDVIDLAGKLPWPKAARAWTKSEGSPSRDGRYWAFQVETDDFQILGFAVWDRVKGKLAGSKTMTERPDHVSMSPSGRWFVSSGDDATVAWPIDFSSSRLVRKGGEHSDLALGADGHDYYVSIDFQSNDGSVFMIDLDTGRRTDLFPTYLDGSATSVHLSGKAFDKPGWIVVSTYDQRGGRRWFSDQIFALELRRGARVYQLAQHYDAVGDAYFAEPQATVDRRFTRILFNSNWGVTGSEDVDTYMIRLGDGAFP